MFLKIYKIIGNLYLLEGCTIEHFRIFIIFQIVEKDDI